MTNRDLKYIIEEIKENEGVDLTDVAAKTKVDRSYLSKFINSAGEKEVTDRLLNKFKKQFPSYFGKKPQETTGGHHADPSLDTILRALSRIENGQSYIRAEIRSYGQYQIQEQVRYDHQKFLQAMDKVGKLYAANLKVGDGQDKKGPNA